MSTRNEGRTGVLGIICLSALLVQAGILLVFLIASLALTGAQVTAGGSAAWGQALPFPVFPVPAWLLTIFAAVGLVAAVLWAVTARPVDARALTGAVGPAVAAAFASGFFMFAFADDGIPLSAYGVPLAISGATVLVLFAAAVIHGARADRGRATGREPEVNA